MLLIQADTQLDISIDGVSNYGGRMTSSVASSGSVLPPLPLAGAAPREVRAALRPEFREQFDQDYREALDEASRTLDLACVYDAVEHWRMRAWITRDPVEHRRVVRRAAQLLSGQEPPVDEPVTATESRL